MAGRFLDLLGTVFQKLQIGIGGPQVKAESGDVAARNAADDAYTAIRAELVKTYGDDFELNAGAAGSGDDWKFTLRRPSTGMTHNLIVVFPAGDPAPGQALVVDDFDTDTITLAYETIAGGADKTTVDTTTVEHGSTSPVAMFTKPEDNLIYLIEVIVDEDFDGAAPQLSIGISGQTSKYMPTTAVNLKATAGTSFEWKPNILATSGAEALIATLNADSSTQGSARIHVHYGAPS